MSLKPITVEEAKQYIPCEEDYTTSGADNAFFFTIVPESDGWDKITYYTARKINPYINRNSAFDSWVYVMSNPTQPDLYKIGYSSKTPEERAKQLSQATGVPLPYKVEWAFNCYNGFSLEQEVHNKLDSFRVNNNREFFRVTLEEAIETIKELGTRYV